MLQTLGILNIAEQILLPNRLNFDYFSNKYNNLNHTNTKLRILLIGEFSRLHNSLKEGLLALGHEVVIVGNGDGFKNYPVDLSTKAKWCETQIGKIPRSVVYRIFRYDIAQIEFGIRFYFHLKKLKGFDVVQLINESAIQTVPLLERWLLKKIIRQNKKIFLLCCGVDHLVAKFLLHKRARYSIMNPYFENTLSHPEYLFVLDYLSGDRKKTHQLVYRNCQGVIASDIDYVLPMQHHPKYLGLVPNPVNTDKITYSENIPSHKINVFLGINRQTYYTKGIGYFEKALQAIENKYAEKVNIIVSENLPYESYIALFDTAHIVLDQVFSFDQGYNALEAMAKGKVVFTGAETEFLEHYGLHENQVAINALADVDYLVERLSWLIENPQQIEKMGTAARKFIEDEHDYLKIAEKYVKTWEKQSV